MEKTDEKSSASMTRPQSTEQSGELSSIPDNMPMSKSVDRSEEPVEYLSGIKLFLVMFSITMAAFLFLLDASIIATVSQGCDSLIPAVFVYSDRSGRLLTQSFSNRLFQK